MDSGKIICVAGHSEIIVKKSRFIGLAEYAENEEAAREIVSGVRKEYYDARHVCYAYIVGEDSPRCKFSDDGEPGGTAGKPILDVITNSGIHNIVVTVTRYFGGVLLGTGGLVRAYTDAAREAVAAAGVKEVCLNRIYDISVDYSEYDKVRFLLDQISGTTIEVRYTDKVIIHLTLPDAASDKMVQDITNLTAARADIKYISSVVG